MIAKFFSSVGAAFRALMLPDGRRAWALVFLAGAGGMMTIYSAAAMWLVRDHASFVLYLGLAAHFTIFIVVTGIAGLLVKQKIDADLGHGRSLSFDTSGADQAPGATADNVRAAAAGAAEGAVAASTTPQS